MLVELGYSVYDSFLPSTGTPYPFVYISETWQNDELNKTAMFGTVGIPVHIYHNNPRQRGTVSAMLNAIRGEAQKIDGRWIYQNGTTQIITDNTTKTPLLHGIITLKFHFS